MSIDQKASTEQRILEAAEKEFEVKGFDGARTTSIASAAGVTHAMLHYYFRSKTHLFATIVRKKAETMGKLITTTFGRKDLPLEERFRQSTGEHFDYVISNSKGLVFMLSEILPNQELMDELFTIILAPLNDYIPALQKELDEAAGKGEMDKVNAITLIRFIVTVNIGVVTTMPIAERILKHVGMPKEEYIANCRQENIELISGRLHIRH